ncbi:hypothetical protein DCMF_26490 [Candidatus Formimonas warabiya]|uniref:Uncharacterized protein n=1 Tax=Formimonas warabiya TaxID=1761012 RepID=A0A3G1KZL5_FORW1|nr:hypothetical protein DCMF_26490 [Candidatus Formimonas warabiya]
MQNAYQHLNAARSRGLKYFKFPFSKIYLRLWTDYFILKIFTHANYFCMLIFFAEVKKGSGWHS